MPILPRLTQLSPVSEFPCNRRKHHYTASEAGGGCSAVSRFRAQKGSKERFPETNAVMRAVWNHALKTFPHNALFLCNVALEMVHETIRAANSDYIRVEMSWNVVRFAKDAGILVYPDECEQCGSTGDVQLHHLDRQRYKRPLEVVPLCRVCHIRLHFNRYRSGPQLITARGSWRTRKPTPEARLFVERHMGGYLTVPRRV